MKVIRRCHPQERLQRNGEQVMGATRHCLSKWSRNSTLTSLTLVHAENFGYRSEKKLLTTQVQSFAAGFPVRCFLPTAIIPWFRRKTLKSPSLGYHAAYVQHPSHDGRPASPFVHRFNKASIVILSQRDIADVTFASNVVKAWGVASAGRTTDAKHDFTIGSGQRKAIASVPLRVIA